MISAWFRIPRFQCDDCFPQNCFKVTHLKIALKQLRFQVLFRKLLSQKGNSLNVVRERRCYCRSLSLWFLSFLGARLMQLWRTWETLRVRCQWDYWHIRVVLRSPLGSIEVLSDSIAVEWLYCGWVLVWRAGKREACRLRMLFLFRFQGSSCGFLPGAWRLSRIVALGEM